MLLSWQLARGSNYLCTGAALVAEAAVEQVPLARGQQLQQAARAQRARARHLRHRAAPHRVHVLHTTLQT